MGEFPPCVPAGAMNTLMFAVRQQNYQEVTDILQHDASRVNELSHGFGAVHWASRINDLKMVKLLISLGSDIHLRDEYGNTCLHLACSSGAKDVASYLLSINFPVNVTNSAGETPMHVAGFSGQKMLQLLLLKGGGDLHS